MEINRIFTVSLLATSSDNVDEKRCSGYNWHKEYTLENPYELYVVYMEV